MGKKKQEKQQSHLLETSVDSQTGLVDLIDKPAWKAILIGLVKSEKMNPWDIDLIELADKYLAKINSLGGKDLRLPANAVLACAILLKFKAKALKISLIEDEEDALEQKEMSPEQIREIESGLPELSFLKSERQGKVSLDDLVGAIEKMLEKNKGTFEKRPFGEKEVINFKVPFSDYNIDELTEKVLLEIKSKADSAGLVLFSRLVLGKTVYEIIDTFMPCLFLANKGKISMWQEDFFGEIMISITDQ